MKRHEKHDWALLLYTREKLTQKEVARRVGVTEKTMSLWVNNEGWEKIRQGLIITKEEQLRRIYMQIDELNTFILKQPEGLRFANSKQADAINKLATAAKKLENDASISDIIEVSKRLLSWLKGVDFEKAKEFSVIIDQFIKQQLT
jgi:transcriptional regulator with XRE-family HTH domain